MRTRILFTLGALLAASPLIAASPTLSLDLGAGVSLDVVLVSSGTFNQGSPAAETGRGEDEVQRKVTLTKDFYIGKTSVTRAQWERFVAETKYRTEAESGPSGGFGWDGTAMTQRKEFTWRNPGFAQSGDHPVCIVTWFDAKAFCDWLSKKAGRSVTLPTEAQWEYAANTGGGISSPAMNLWSKQNAGNTTHPVTSTTATGRGLHIGGNVAEWCEDWYAPYAGDEVTNPLQNNQNLSDKPRRVLRGGSWARDAKNTLPTARYRADARSRNADIGFRVVVAADLPSPAGVPLPRFQPTLEAPIPSNEAPPIQAVPQSPSNTHYVNVPAAKGIGGGSVILGLLCPLALAGGLFFIIRMLVRAFSGSKSAATPGASMGRPAQPVSGGGLGAGVRVVDDGFWILLDSVPAGSRVHFSYQPAGGMDVSDSIIYKPGPEGQFIYTGARPENARVSSVEASGDPLGSSSTMHSGGPGARGTGFAIGNVLGSGTRSSHHGSRKAHSTENEPTRYPSAY